MNREATRFAPRVRRAYFECRYGQLHMHNAVPGGGGFDELTTVICLHSADETGRVFNPVVDILGADRSVFAPDLPGCGESDPAPGVDFVTAGALAVADFIASMRIRSVDLVAHGAGCDIAQRLALDADSRVRRLVLVTDKAPAQIARMAAPVTIIAPTSVSQMAALGTRLVEALSG
jgi:pimeloyl-ACP methyl ester carboxylesterase